MSQGSWVKPEHIIEDEDDKDEDNEDEDNEDDTNNYNETDDEPESNEEPDSPTTDEIIQMYENMSEDELKPFKVKRTTRKNIAKKSLTKTTLRRVQNNSENIVEYCMKILLK